MVFENPHSKSAKQGEGIADLINFASKAATTIAQNKDLIGGVGSTINAAVNIKKLANEIARDPKPVPKTSKPKAPKPKPVDQKLVNEIMEESEKLGSAKRRQR